jgi:VanZ family protein
LILLWVPVAIYMAAIFYGSLMATVPGPVGSWFSDTFLHAGGYFGLALLTLRAVARDRWDGVSAGAMLTAFAISMLHGAAVEWLQMYVPTRMAEWRDLVNDAIGAGLALGAAKAWGIMRTTSRAEPDS